MEKVTFICPECGYTIDRWINLDYDEDVICPLCDEIMEVKDNFQVKYAKTPEELDSIYGEDLLDKAISMDVLTIMKHHISTLGSKRCWELIEDFKSPVMRLKYRKLFFDAEGEIPKRKELT